MGKHPQHLGKTVCLNHVEEFELFELKAVLGIHYEQYEVGNFGNVEHSLRRVWAFEERHSAVFARGYSDWPNGIVEIVVGI